VAGSAAEAVAAARGERKRGMKVMDRHLAREVVRFALIALTSVVVIYLLVDLFEELNYFTSRKATVANVLLYYMFSLPSAITLLYPVSCLLGVFLVYGQMVRHRELHALESAGVSALRLFVPAVGVGLATVVLYLVGQEFVTIPANIRLDNHRRVVIEKRTAPEQQKRRNVYFVGEAGRVFYVREFESAGVMRDFSIKELSPDRLVRTRIDGNEAVYRDSVWVGFGISVREFHRDGTETLVRHDSLVLAGLVEKPEDFTHTTRPVYETSTADLRRFIARLKRAGEDVAEEEVEYHYRFSYSLIGLIVVLIGLPLSVRLRKGGVMFGLGIGLLVSFLYWGAIQMSRAYGGSHVISPVLAAWLPNVVFGVVAVVLIANVKQ
jgi:lipopolysaccharide export system permease protein